MKDKALHMIGNAHIDPVWLWRWQEGFQEVKATFRSALERMKEYPEFVFVASSAAFYEWVEQSDPKMFAEIRERIAEGRWGIVGGWWIEPDCNIPRGESFVRQGLYGQHYFKDRFGFPATVGYNVDSFGHHAMLPQILKKSGLEFYVFMRPQAHEKDLPAHTFWWESDDGSRVLAFRIPYSYGTWDEDLEAHVRRCTGLLKGPINELMCFYGVGNHGGGPTKENIESIRRMKADHGFPKLIFSTPDRFFSAILAKGLPIPTVHDDLQHHASGCYAAHSAMKRWNRRAENLLITAEKYAAIASWVTGQSYPTDFARAWKNVLFNQFHDILAGTSLEVAYDDASHPYGEAMAIAGRGLNAAIQSLAWNIRIETEHGVTPIVVFNPHAWATKVNVELEIRDFKETDTLVDDEGRQVPTQMIESQASTAARHRLSFIADLPSMGYRAYRLTPQISATDGDAPLEATDSMMENDHFRLKIDPATGYITGLYDKLRRLQVFLDDAAKPVVIDDPSDTWSHDVIRFNRETGVFVARSVRLVEHGPVKSVIRVRSEYGASSLIQDFTMYREIPQIDVHVTVEWHEQLKVLKLQFPLNIDSAKATYEIPYGHIQRPVNGEEEPGQSWIDVSGVARDAGVSYGLSLLNDGKYSFDVNGNVMSLTVLRSPIYAHHDPLIPAPDRDYAFIDQGIQRFTYALLPHQGNWAAAGTVRHAATLNQRPIVLIETDHPEGTFPQADSYLSVDRDNIIVSVIKKAEDDDSMIIRCYESSGAPTEAAIRLPEWNRVIEARFGPCEIKTFRIPKDGAQPIVETDLLEWTR